jgi:hypothetical protein
MPIEKVKRHKSPGIDHIPAEITEDGATKEMTDLKA